MHIILIFKKVGNVGQEVLWAMFFLFRLNWWWRQNNQTGREITPQLIIKARMMGTQQERPKVPRDSMPDLELDYLRQWNVKDRWVRGSQGDWTAERRPHCLEGNWAFACNPWHFMHSNLNLKENHHECSVGNISVSLLWILFDLAGNHIFWRLGMGNGFGLLNTKAGGQTTEFPLVCKWKTVDNSQASGAINQKNKTKRDWGEGD